MNALDLWHECRRLSVRLSVKDSGLACGGKKSVLWKILPALAANKTAMLACVEALRGLPVADGPYVPYCVPLTPERVAAMLTECKALVNVLAAAEGWPESHRDNVLTILTRQPVATLADDLAYFREQLAALPAAAAEPEVKTCAACIHFEPHRPYGVPVGCAMSRALNWKHHEWLDHPDQPNPCVFYEKRGADKE